MATTATPSPTYRDGVRAGLPLLIPTLLIGVTFGLLARSLGWGVVAPIACSLLVFSGSAQLAAVSVLGAGGGAASAIVAALLVNARFLAMGVAVGPSLKGGRLRRALEGQTIVDASWAVSSLGDGRFSRELMIGATVPQWVGWQVGTVLGVFGGQVMGDAERYGLDVIFPAFFVALLFDELRRPGTAPVALLAGVVALVLVPLTPPGVPIIVAAAAALLGGSLRGSAGSSPGGELPREADR